MKSTMKQGLGLGAALALAGGLLAGVARAAEPSLVGTWSLTAADRLYPDGARARDYGDHPKGRLIIDAQGRYSLQIFKAERARFALADKKKGSPAEFEGAVLGSSTHYGAISVAADVLTFRIEAASFPNWEGTEQTRRYELKGDQLSYQVPTAPDGTVPISVWKGVE
jgi:hypothetical protein